MRANVREVLGSMWLSVAVAWIGSAARVHGAEVALFYSTYQEQQSAYMPGEYATQYNLAGDIIKESGFDWDRVDSQAVEGGELVRKGHRVLVISYVSVMSQAEAAAIAEFAKSGGRIFAVYASCASEWKDGKAGEPGPGILADVLGMESAGTEGGVGYMKGLEPNHPLLQLLPGYLFNPHGYSVRMKPRPGTKVVANWVRQDFSTPFFGDQDSGAFLASPAAVYFSGFLWRIPEATIIVNNALAFLLGRERKGDDVTWVRSESAVPVEAGLNLRFAKTDREDMDALGWRMAEPWHGILRPTCAVVYPVDGPESYCVARRLARALSVPLVPDRAVTRDILTRSYDLIVVGRLLPDRCENPIGSMQRGIAPLLTEYAAAKNKSVVRLAPADPSGKRKGLVLVGGDALEGLMRAESAVRRGVQWGPEPAQAGLLVWQPTSAFGDLVYPWTPAGEPIAALTLPSAVNQWARTQFVLTTTMGHRMAELDLRLSALSGPGGTIAPERIKLLATRYVKSNVSKIEEPDPLVPVTHVAIDPGGHQQVWFMVDCTGAAPGVYTGSLSVVDDRGADLARLAITLEVAPIVLAPKNRHDLLTTVWDYAVSGHMHGNLLNHPPGNWPSENVRSKSTVWGRHYEQHFRRCWRAYVADLEDHGVNAMFLSTTMGMPQYQLNGKQIDEDMLGKLVPYGREHGFRLFIFTQILGQGCYYPDSDRITSDGSPIFSPAWDEAYKAILRAYMDFAARQGLDFKEWAIYPFDEAHCAKDARLINHVASLIDQVEPRIQLWSDPTASQEKGVSTLDLWKSMENSVDIWWPADGNIREGTDTLQYLRSLGKPFGFYNCAAYHTKNRASVQPDRYYRSFGFSVAQRGTCGMGFWTWCAWRGDSWDDEDVANGDGDGAVVYEGPDGPVTSISWEAWGEGMDDYKYVAALKAAIAKREAAVGVTDPRCVEARKTLAETVDRSVRNIREADGQRLRLRQAILDLAK